jgi:glycosyltransferase involved in cell wall biosynthesis
MAHVVVDARMAWASGIGTYIRNLVPQVARLAQSWRFTLIVDRDSMRSLDWATPNALRQASAGIYSIAEQIEIPTIVPADADLYWATHYNFPLLTRKPLVVTIHDMAHLRLPEFTNSNVKHAYARFMFTMARRRAAGLLFVSQFTRNEFESLVGSSNGTSAVVHNGVAPEWFAPTADESRDPPLAQPYFLYVGNIKPHKNVLTLLAAFEEVSRSIDVRLVLAGRSENLRTGDSSVLSKVAAVPKASFLGELENATLRRYVRNAAALIVPSTYEGFGLPALEAMAAGCPAIVSRAASLPEICGDAALYFDHQNPAELAKRMLEIARDPAIRNDLIARGRAHARQFDWHSSAEQTHALLSSVLSR